jgi:hypothetical protein
MKQTKCAAAAQTAELWSAAMLVGHAPTLLTMGLNQQ